MDYGLLDQKKRTMDFFPRKNDFKVVKIENEIYLKTCILTACSKMAFS